MTTHQRAPPVPTEWARWAASHTLALARLACADVSVDNVTTGRPITGISPAPVIGNGRRVDDNRSLSGFTRIEARTPNKWGRLEASVVS